MCNENKRTVLIKVLLFCVFSHCIFMCIDGNEANRKRSRKKEMNKILRFLHFIEVYDDITAQNAPAKGHEHCTCCCCRCFRYIFVSFFDFLICRCRQWKWIESKTNIKKKTNNWKQKMFDSQQNKYSFEFRTELRPSEFMKCRLFFFWERIKAYVIWNCLKTWIWIETMKKKKEKKKHAFDLRTRKTTLFLLLRRLLARFSRPSFIFLL